MHGRDLAVVYLFDVALEAHQHVMNDFFAKLPLLHMQSLLVPDAELVHVVRVVIGLEDVVKLVVVSKEYQLFLQLLRKAP